MKALKLALLAASAVGSCLAASCCASEPAPEPMAPTYVEPAK